MMTQKAFDDFLAHIGLAYITGAIVILGLVAIVSALLS